MPQFTGPFDSADILRITANNLTGIERDMVICTILAVTGHANSRAGTKTILDAIRQLSTGFAGIASLALDIAVELSGEGKYTADY